MKKIFHLIIIATFLLTAFASTSYAQGGFASGSGTAADPYMISTPQQLDNIRHYLGYERADLNFALKNDIDMSSVSNFKTLGSYVQTGDDIDSMFYGKFDGRGYVIRNLTIKETSRKVSIGLFSCIERQGVVKNLGIENGYLSFENRHGGFIAGTSRGTIENCHAIGKIESKSGINIGGLVGNAWAGVIFKSCIVKNCYAIVTINASANDQNVSVGGIVGWAVSMEILNCYALVDLAAEEGEVVGGICGQMRGGRVTNCYSYGVIRGKARVGGIMGYQYSTNYLATCYSAIQVQESAYTKEITDPYKRQCFGGILGGIYSTYEIVKECYHDKNVFKGRGVGMDSAGDLYAVGAVAMTTEEMMKATSYEGTGWKFDSKWSIWEGNSYPYFPNLLTPVNISAATPTYIEGIYKSDDAPDNIIIYDQKLKVIGQAVINTENQTWRFDAAAAPLAVNEYVYAIASKGKKQASPAIAQVANTYFAGGNGMENNPFRITTPEQLRNIRFYLGAESAGMHFVIANDLDFKNEPVWISLRNGELREFYGKIDGKNYKIKNLNIDNTSLDSVGLFSVIAPTGVVTNINLLGCTVAGNTVVGSICGVNNGSISNCFAFGKVNGNSNIGGLCGVNNKAIANSYIMAKVKSTGEICGGFCGTNGAAATIDKSYVIGEVNANTKAGGFCGINNGIMNITYAANTINASDFGGFCAENNGGVTISYFDKQLASTDKGAVVGSETGITGLTTESMKKKAGYRGWIISSMDGDWSIWENNSYVYWGNQTAPPIITSIKANMVQGICNTTSAPDSIVLFKNYERIGSCTPGVAAWQISLGSTPLQSTDLLYAVAYMVGKEPSRLALVENIPNDASLKSLAVNGNNVIPQFSPSVFDYTVMPFANSVDSITVAAVANNVNATVNGTGRKILNAGANKYQVVVTSEDKSVTATYNITVVRKDANYTLSNNATLKTLDALTNAGSLTANFSADVTQYTASVLNSVESVNIAAVCNHPYATIEGTGVRMLNIGENILVVKVTAEDGTTVKEYTIVITRMAENHVASDNALLAALQTDKGSLSPEFEGNTANYTVKVNGDVTSINITASPNQSGAQVNGAGTYSLKVGRNEIIVTVIAEDGVTKKTYKVVVERALPSDVQLQSLTVSGTSFEPSLGTSFTYVAECGVTTADVAVTANEGTTVMINGRQQNSCSVTLPQVGMDKVSVQLISADQLTTRTYELIVSRSLPESFVQLRWKNILALNNNPENNGGYVFRSFQWYKNGVAVSGETQPYIRISGSPSQYMVKAITVEGYELHTCPLSNNMRAQAEQIVAYPNPVRAGGILNLEMPNTEDGNAKSIVNIINVQGKIVRNVTVSGTNAGITMPTQQGMYILQVIDENKNVQTLKVIVY